NMGPPSAVVTAFAPPTDDPHDYIEFQFDLDPQALGGLQVTRSMEVSDPRIGGLAKSWVAAPGFSAATNPNADTLGAQNSATSRWDTSKFAFVDFSNPS